MENLAFVYPSKTQLNIIVSFEKWLISENLSELTIQYYVKKIKMFFDYCDIKKVEKIRVNTDIIREYLEYLRTRENFNTQKGTLASSTRAKHFDAMKRYANFLLEKRYINESPILGIRRPIPRYKVIEGLSKEQLHSLMDAILKVRTTELCKERTIVLIFFLVGTGLRISEALQLRPIDFYFSKRIVKVLGKGDIEREVPYGDEISSLMKYWIEKQNIGRQEYIWQGRNGNPLTATSFRSTLSRAQKYIGQNFEMDRMKVTPHVLRHTFAKFWVVKNGNTIALSKILGHTTTQMTDKYVRMWGTDIVEAYDECSPINGIVVPKLT